MRSPPKKVSISTTTMNQSLTFLFKKEFSEGSENSSPSQVFQKQLSQQFHQDSFYFFSGTFQHESRRFFLVVLGGLLKSNVSEQQVTQLVDLMFTDSNYSSFLTAAEARFLPDKCANSELNPLFKKRKKQKSFRSIRSLRSALLRFFFFVSKEETIRWDQSLESYDFSELFLRLGQTGPFLKTNPEWPSATDIQADLLSLRREMKRDLKKLEERIKQLEDRLYLARLNEKVTMIR